MQLLCDSIIFPEPRKLRKSIKLIFTSQFQKSIAEKSLIATLRGNENPLAEFETKLIFAKKKVNW